MKSLKNFGVIAVLSLSAFGTMDVQAGPCRHRGGEGAGEGGERMVQKLDLTEAQRTQFAEIRKANVDKMKANEKAMREKQEKFESAIQSNTSKDELRKIHKEVQQARAEMGELRFEQILAIRDILTPEQRSKFRQGGPGRGDGMKRGHGPGRGQGRGCPWNSDENE